MEDVYFHWKDTDTNDTGKFVHVDQSHPEYRIGDIKLRRVEIGVPSGNYSRLAFDFKLTRHNTAWHVMVLYVPLFMVIILSCFLFYLDRY